MATTEKYGLFIGEANDPFSPLIQFNANMRLIDSNMWENNQRGVRVVSEIKTGRVHELTTVSGAGNMMRFVATSNWESGDTCTVDGTAVTTLLPSGQPLPNGAWVINSNVLCCLVGTVLTVFTYYIKEYAPTGYGLGEEITVLTDNDDLNTLVGNGFFGWGASKPANAPLAYCVMLQLYRTPTSVTQVIWQVGDRNEAKVSVVRHFVNGVGEWEYNNPPMIIGVEYRTTERYNGKPVYALAVFCGDCPVEGFKEIRPPEAANVDVLVRASFRSAAGTLLPKITGGTSNYKWNSQCNAGVSSNQIFIDMDKGYSEDNLTTGVTASLYYTKTTD